MQKSTDKMTYVGLLRGINVAGHSTIKMEELREACLELRFDEVRTYLQSGNIIFTAPAETAEQLSEKIKEMLLRKFRLAVTVIVKTPEELLHIIEGNPFLKQRGIDASKLHVTFLARVPEDAALKSLQRLSAAPDQFRCSGKDIYLYCPDGYGRSKLSNNAFEKLLAVSATTRNWNTVTKLHELSGV